MLDDLAMFGLACFLALQTWVGIALLGLYVVVLFMSGEVILAGVLGVLLTLLVWRKLHVRTTVVELEEEGDD